MGKRQGWPWFLAWTVAGGLLAFSLLTWLALFLLPAALAAVLLAARLGRVWPELLGAVTGAGLTLLGIAFANRDFTPCPASGELTVPPGGTSESCGGLDPVPWLVAGLVLVAAGIAAHALVRARSPAVVTDSTRSRA